MGVERGLCVIDDNGSTKTTKKIQDPINALIQQAQVAKHLSIKALALFVSLPAQLLNVVR